MKKLKKRPKVAATTPDRKYLKTRYKSIPLIIHIYNNKRKLGEIHATIDSVQDFDLCSILKDKQVKYFLNSIGIEKEVTICLN